MTVACACKYDAWNRLVEIKSSETVVGRFEYDGPNRRVKKHIDSDARADPDGVDLYRHFFCNGRGLLPKKPGRKPEPKPNGRI